jgi:acyl dehydratase
MLVTDERIDLFLRLSGDRNPLHVDDDFARKTSSDAESSTAA